MDRQIIEIVPLSLSEDVSGTTDEHREMRVPHDAEWEEWILDGEHGDVIRVTRKRLSKLRGVDLDYDILEDLTPGGPMIDGFWQGRDRRVWSTLEMEGENTSRQDAVLKSHDVWIPRRDDVFRFYWDEPKPVGRGENRRLMRPARFIWPLVADQFHFLQEKERERRRLEELLEMSPDTVRERIRTRVGRTFVMIELNTTMREEERQRKEAEAALARIQDELQTLRSERDGLQGRAERAEAMGGEVETLRAEKDRLVARVGELETAFGAVRTEKDQLEARIKEFERAQEELRGRIQVLEREIAAQEREAQSEKETQERRIGEFEGEIERLRQELREKSHALGESKAENRRLDAKLTDAEVSIDSERAAAAQLSKEKIALERRLDALEAELRKLIEDREKDRITHAERIRVLQKTEADLREANAQRDMLEARLRATEEALDAEGAATTELSKEKAAADLELARLQAELERLRAAEREREEVPEEITPGRTLHAIGVLMARASGGDSASRMALNEIFPVLAARPPVAVTNGNGHSSEPTKIPESPAAPESEPAPEAATDAPLQPAVSPVDLLARRAAQPGRRPTGELQIGETIEQEQEVSAPPVSPAPPAAPPVAVPEGIQTPSRLQEAQELFSGCRARLASEREASQLGYIQEELKRVGFRAANNKDDRKNQLVAAATRIMRVITRAEEELAAFESRLSAPELEMAGNGSHSPSIDELIADLQGWRVPEIPRVNIPVDSSPSRYSPRNGGGSLQGDHHMRRRSDQRSENDPEAIRNRIHAREIQERELRRQIEAGDNNARRLLKRSEGTLQKLRERLERLLSPRP